MTNYKAIISYDGTDYIGWQMQARGHSIQATLQDAFVQTFGMPVTIRAASRTDAGVHAYGQVIQFVSGVSCSAEQMRVAWNHHLPISIVIRSIEIQEASFHPWYNVEQKIYWYQFFVQQPLPFYARYGWSVQRPVNINKLRSCLSLFVGTHDFTSFACAQDTRINKIYTIDDISLEYISEYNMYRIVVKGARFMRHMIRRIVGASLFVAHQPYLEEEHLRTLLHAKNPNHPYVNAPAHGLTLYNIRYKEEL